MSLLATLKAADEDHEWYPTTNEIIAALLRDMRKKLGSKDSRRYSHRDEKIASSVLDIGAGNGKVLDAIHADKELDIETLYAIEKSTILCGQLDARIFVIGTEFEQQSLITKPVGFIFCNPPYSVFKAWMQKIIREAAAPHVYMVVPMRWRDDEAIKDALKFRSAEAHIIGSFDFEDAEDRRARAYVHLVRIDLSHNSDDAFDAFFNEQFADLKAAFEAMPKGEEEDRWGEKPKHDKFASLVIGATYPEAMVALYQEELGVIQRNYAAVTALDPVLLKEFAVTLKTISGTLKTKLSGLRMEYWKELFSRLTAITERLIAKKRQELLGTLQKHVHVDFTVGNIHAVVIWAIKNSNQYLDAQLLEVFQEMVCKANVVNYKSNQRAFVADDWRYRNDQMREGEKPTHFALEYRIVLEHSGGIRRGYSFERGLEARAACFLMDLQTVARNLGFQPDAHDDRLSHPRDDCWTSGTKHEFWCHNAGKKRREILFDVRAFLNGNMHIRLNQDFALCLNVEFGRLKGWIKSGRHAADELGKPEAAKFYGTLQPIMASTVPMLEAPDAPPPAKQQPYITFDLSQAA